MTVTVEWLRKVADTKAPQALPSVAVRRRLRRLVDVSAEECADVMGMKEADYRALEHGHELAEHEQLSRLLQALEALAVARGLVADGPPAADTEPESVETVERVDNRESAEERCQNCRAAHERVRALEGMLRDALGLIRSGPFAF